MIRRDHTSEVILLGLIALGVMILMGFNHRQAVDAAQPFDPSAYLVVLTLIVGAIKERWTQRSVDRMGDQLAGSAPPPSGPLPVVVTNTPEDPAQVQQTDGP